MKRILFHPILYVFASTSLLSFTTTPRNYQTECVNISNDGYIEIKIWDTKKGASYKSEDARKDAIHAILYSGIASVNGCSTQPPLLKKQNELEKFRKIQKSFFRKNGKWSVFTRSSTTKTTLPRQFAINDWKVYHIYISSNELRKFLESEKIINSLNAPF